MRELLTNFRWYEDGSSQSMLVEEGLVVARGPEVGGTADATRDLGGATLHPSFVDSHCHILPTGLDLQKLNLGPFSTPEEVLQAVFERNQTEPEDQWLRAVWYDQTKFPSGEHLTRHDLDKISSTRPIVLRHVNGHASIANTAALESAGISDDTPDPEGGTFVRDSSGSLTGVLLEKAHEMVFDSGPKLTQEQMVEAILIAGDRMAELGIVCASDMMTGRFDVETEIYAYAEAARRGCKIRTRLYVLWSPVFGGRGIGLERLRSLASEIDSDAVRIAGIKIFADGAIGSRTAGIYGSYEGEPAAERSGIMNYSNARLAEMVRVAHEAGYQVCIHSIGDYSTDCVLDAFEALDDASRHRIEHVMLMSDRQIDRLARVGCFATMQPEFLVRFGHAYRRNLGEERASKLKRARSFLDRGIKLAFNSDRPIVAGDPRDGIRTAVSRPVGFDPSENVSMTEAIDLYTSCGDLVNGDVPGRLAAGQRAEYVVA